MYGYEATTGLGGLAAQAPYQNPYLAGALRIRDPGSMIVGDETQIAGGTTSPQFLLGVPRGGVPMISATGANVTRDPGQQLGNWREILDWHNSPAPWVLLMLLFIYGYVHISYRKGRAVAGLGLGR